MIVLLLSSSCRPSAERVSGSLRGANILLITIDTLRADRLGSYGARTPTPVLDQLASTGARFATTYAHTPLTLPSHASILTGKTPPSHGVRTNGIFRLAETHTTLAEALQTGDYRTGAFVGAFTLDARFGLNQGFEEYDDPSTLRQGQGRLEEGREATSSGPSRAMSRDGQLRVKARRVEIGRSFKFAERRARDVLDHAAAWILDEGDRSSSPSSGAMTTASADQPWFAWVELFDPHAPYDVPEARAADPYDNEVAYVDAELGRLFERLRAAPATLDRTLIVVTSDHGESLGAHGEDTHGLFAYDETLRVPLIMHAPTLGPRVPNTLATHADVMPTILDLVGLPAPASVQGRSLASALEGTELETTPVYFEALDANLTRNWAPLIGIIAGGWKLIELPIAELYDLSRDPKETANLFSSETDRARVLSQELAALRGRLADPTPIIGTRPGVENSEKLQALGYITAPSAQDTTPRVYSEADDPKTLLSANQAFVRAATVADTDPEEALTALRTAIAKRPDFVGAYMAEANLLQALGRPNEAVQVLQQPALGERMAPEVLERLGSALRMAGDAQGAVRVLAPLVASNDASLDGRQTLGLAYLDLKLPEDARRQFTAVLAVDPTAAETWQHLGALELNAGRRAEAADAYKHAVAEDPELAESWKGLGTAVAASEPQTAINAWRRCVELTPDDYTTLYELARLLLKAGQRADAQPYVDRFLAEAPRSRYAKEQAVVKAMVGAKQ